MAVNFFDTQITSKGARMEAGAFCTCMQKAKSTHKNPAQSILQNRAKWLCVVPKKLSALRTKRFTSFAHRGAFPTKKSTRTSEVNTLKGISKPKAGLRRAKLKAWLPPFGRTGHARGRGIPLGTGGFRNPQPKIQESNSHTRTKTARSRWSAGTVVNKNGSARPPARKLCPRRKGRACSVERKNSTLERARHCDGGQPRPPRAWRGAAEPLQILYSEAARELPATECIDRGKGVRTIAASVGGCKWPAPRRRTEPQIEQEPPRGPNWWRCLQESTRGWPLKPLCVRTRWRFVAHRWSLGLLRGVRCVRARPGAWNVGWRLNGPRRSRRGAGARRGAAPRSEAGRTAARRGSRRSRAGTPRAGS